MAKKLNVSIISIIILIFLNATYPMTYANSYQNIPACSGGMESADVPYDSLDIIQNIYYRASDISRGVSWGHSIVRGNNGDIHIKLIASSYSTFNIQLYSWSDPNGAQHGLTSFSGNDQALSSDMFLYFTITSDAVTGTYTLTFSIYLSTDPFKISLARFIAYFEVVSAADTMGPSPSVTFDSPPSEVHQGYVFSLEVDLTNNGANTARNTGFAYDCQDGLQIYLENVEFADSPIGLVSFNNNWLAFDHGSTTPRDIVGAQVLELYITNSMAGGSTAKATLFIRTTGAIGEYIRIKYKAWMLDDDLVYNTQTDRVENVIMWASHGSPSWPFNGEWAQNPDFQKIARTSSPIINIKIYSETADVTVNSYPAGSGHVTVDGNAIVTPKTFSWDIGSSHTLLASSIIYPVVCKVNLTFDVSLHKIVYLET